MEAAEPTRVRVYRNLNRGCWSIQVRLRYGWCVVGHATAVILTDARFSVGESARQKIIAGGRKTVHAWIEGDLEHWSGTVREGSEAPEALHRTLGDRGGLGAAVAGLQARYNPRQMATFETAAGEAIFGADRVVVGEHGVVIAGVAIAKPDLGW